MTKHKDYKATQCPHKTVELGWQRFLDMVQSEMDSIGEAPDEYAVLRNRIKKLESKLNNILQIAMTE